MPPSAMLDLADALGLGVGEAAGLVTEKLAFHQMIGDGARIDRNERAISPGTVLMDEAGSDLLASAPVSPLRRMSTSVSATVRSRCCTRRMTSVRPMSLRAKCILGLELATKGAVFEREAPLSRARGRRPRPAGRWQTASR